MAERRTVADVLTATSGFAAVLDQVGDQWDAATPCEGWSAGEVVDHVIGNLKRIAGSLGGEAENGEDRAARFRAAADALVAIAGQDGVLERKVPAPLGGELPAFVVIGIVTTDVLVHTWDLAQALGVDVTLDEDLAQRSLDGAVPVDEILRGPGLFGPKVAVPDGAPPQARMLGFFGRTPR